MRHDCQPMQQMTTFTEYRNGRFIIIENVPAWVCEQCGETLYDPEVVDQIQAVVWSDKPPVRTIETPVYDLSA